ncbi:hypothetical protein VM1G_11316 [Cytospora mali]|uniref:Uncharacterized protein n=1 Tax=Cytospora mali TaxID=578113 RepID=A0A194VNX5_CYTMA|nr:hypothetical protein VM1G_11316 [Valsa mali]
MPLLQRVRYVKVGIPVASSFPVDINERRTNNFFELFPNGKDITYERRNKDPRNNHPSIPWLTESWLAKVVPYERIATASPRLGVGIIRQGLLDHYINLLPNITGFGDFMPVPDSSGRHLGHRVKVATWPLTKQDELRARKFAA